MVSYKVLYYLENNDIVNAFISFKQAFEFLKKQEPQATHWSQSLMELVLKRIKLLK